MYTLKTIARRGTSLGAALSLAVAAVIPAVFPSGLAFADALNPLTERSLTLSSSSPGWAYTDGSGNSTYAPPNSGANGQKTGNYFDFKVSSGTAINTFSFQYCTTSAGDCLIPGNDTVAGTDSVSAQEADLNTVFPTTVTDHEVPSGSFSTVVNSSTGAVKAVPGYTNNNPKYSGSGDPAEAAKAVTGSYIVMTESGGTWTPSSGWKVEAKTVTPGTRNATKNYIILTNDTGLTVTPGQRVKVLFFANGSDYITNPGEGAFFVKINTYSKEFADSPTAGQVDVTGLAPATVANVIDGGVTVANVMNQSIQITTKVLETMQFSVGTVDPNTLTNAELGKADGGSAAGPKAHTPCDTIKTALVKGDSENVLQLGNQSAESSLETNKAYATHSYWRLSSNSSAGATVYYSGHTLSNTSGDEIQPIGKIPKNSAVGSEQFGLAIATTPVSGGTYGVNYAQDRDLTDPLNPVNVWENGADNGKTAIDASTTTDVGGNGSYHISRLDPLVPAAAYKGGSGKINTDSLGTLGTNTARYDSGDLSADNPDANAAFAFDAMSDTVPAAIATEDAQVVDCVTAKMRYIGNIAATTPAGIYTTKINYIAAPQY